MMSITNWKAEAETWKSNAEHLGNKYQAVCIALGIDKNAPSDVAVERARSQTSDTKIKTKMIVDQIDRARREAVQRRNAAKGEVSEMYYEGAIQALAGVQAFAETVHGL